MKFCPECGFKLEDDALFCGECGTRQSVEEVMPEPVVEEVIPEPVAEEVIPEPVAEEVIPEPVAEEVISEPAVEEPVVEEAAAGGNICPKCGFENAEGDRFCMECGFDMAAPAEEAAPVEMKLYCPACAQVNEEGDAFCMKCGQSLAGVALSAAPAVMKENKAREAAEAAGKAAKKAAGEAKKLAAKGAGEVKKIAKKAKGVKLPKVPKAAYLAAGVAVVIGLVLVILALCGVFSGGKGADLALYVKDGEIYFTDFGRDEPLQVTDRLADDMENEDLAQSAYALSDYTALVKGESRVFYPDRIDDNDEGVTIYYRDLNKKKDAEKLDSEIIQYAVNEKGNQVIYLKGEDGKLYRSDLKDKEKIASDVAEFFVTEDLQKVIYRDTDGDIYIKTAKGDKEKIASDVDDIYYVAENLQSLYYEKDADLYLQKIGADKKKLADDVNGVVQVYEDGQMFFVTAEEEKLDLGKYVADPMAANDASLTEPAPIEYPSKPRSRDYDTKDEYNKALDEYNQTCEDLEKENDAAWEAYWAKCDRDAIRESLKTDESNRLVYTLHFFDGEEVTKVAENLADPYMYAQAADKPVVAFAVAGSFDGVKLNIADIAGSWEVTDALRAAGVEGTVTYICQETAMVAVPEDYYLRDVSADGKTVALMGDVNDKREEGSIYTASFKNGELGELKLVDEDVYSSYGRFFADGKLAYFKDVSDRNYEGDLFLDGKEADYDVYVYSLHYSKALEGCLYTTDTKDGEGGTLKLLSGRKPKVIGEDIDDYMITDGGEVVFLSDYSERKFTGEMYLYGRKNSLVDEDVVAMLQTVHGAGEVCGGRYYW